MIVPSPEALNELLDRYRDLESRDAGPADAETRRQLEDVTYTLCVCTGTRDVAAALEVADLYVGGGGWDGAHLVDSP